MSFRSRRIARGVARLDYYKPGWHHLITRPLDLSDEDDCVLGQVYNGFQWGLRRTEIFSPSRYGFMTHCALYYILTYPLGWKNRDRVGEFLFRRSERKYADAWQAIIDARKAAVRQALLAEQNRALQARSARRLADDIEIFIQRIHKDALYSQKVDA